MKYFQEADFPHYYIIITNCLPSVNSKKVKRRHVAASTRKLFKLELFHLRLGNPDVSQTVHSLGIPLSQAKRRHISAVSLFSSAQQTIISHWAVARRRSKSSILSALSSANISILCPKVFSAPRRADTADRHIITAENMKITAVS